MQQAINVVIPPLFSPYTYLLPEPISAKVQIGDRLLVPLGSRSATGFVVEKRIMAADSIASAGFVLKPIENEASIQRCFNPADLEFYRWVASYYGVPLSAVIDVAVPQAAPPRFSVSLRLAEKAPFDRVRGKLQQSVINALQNSPHSLPYKQILKTVKGGAAAVKKLVEQGLIISSKVEIVDQHIISEPLPKWAKSAVQLNSDQERAVDWIAKHAQSRAADTLLLHGITGSGKTEVYIESIKRILQCGMGALVLVPEIALTPQLIDRFRARLGDRLAILHSALSRRVRWDSWRALLEGRNMVAIGARSAVFAPIANLGLVIVDEEHDASYKQNDGLRYNARDLAVARAKMAGCPAVLGSATPSLESYLHASRKKYFYLKLSSRHKATAKFDVEIVDLNRVKPWEMSSKNISPRLAELLGDTITSGRQAFILYNRRGFATYLQCDKCEKVIECPNCSVTMTYHQRGNMLLCHYCNSSRVPPFFCGRCAATPESGGPGKLLQRGAGTEKVFEELHELFPQAVIDRLDRDAASDIDKYRAILQRVRDKTTSILVGTQMIAKGHDIPDVTLVGVVDCDVGLHMPDFRAAERIFQLLTQAAGRAGRDERRGSVILQTRVPLHPSLLSTLKQDYAGFAAQELAKRNALQYPPFARLLRVIAQSSEKDEAGLFLNGARRGLLPLIESEGLAVSLLGPALAPIEKIKTMWRWHMLIKSRSVKNLHRIREYLKSLKIPSKRLKLIFDLDPQEML